MDQDEDLPPPDDERDRRVGEALEAYLERLRRGERIGVDEWAGRYPEIAAEVRECLETLALLPGDASRAPPAGVGPAPRVAGYTVLGEIGRGGMGVVYRALQARTRRLVALKFMATGPAVSPEARRRFEREVELAAALDHPGIVRVLESGEAEGGVYCAMDLVDGKPLHQHLAAAALSAEERVRLFLPMAEAVHYAHLRGVIHRDLKPSNVMVDREGRVRILDFGLARLAAPADLGSREGFVTVIPEASREGAETVTREGQLLGTLPYLSPEQVTGASRDLDLRSDLYSLGVILYEMLAGRSPYATSGPLADALNNICHALPPPPSRFARGLRKDLDAVVLKSLEKPREARYQTAAALADDLRCYLRGEPVEATRGSGFYLLRKAYARHRRQVQLALVGLLGLVIASGALLSLHLRLRREYHLAVLRRGLAHLAAGHDALAEALLLPAYRSRPDAPARWSLLSWYVQNPLAASVESTRWVSALSWSRGGLMAYGNLDGSLVVRDASAFEIVASIPGPVGGVRCMEFTSDGRRLVTGGADGWIRAWDAGSWTASAARKAHEGAVTRLRISRDGGRLLTAGADGTMLLWILPDFRDPRAPGGHCEAASHVEALDLSPDGKRIAAATADRALVVWNPEEPAPPATLRGFSAPVEAARFSPDGRTIAAWSGEKVSLWDLITGTRLWNGSGGLSEPRPVSLWDGSPKDAPHLTWRPTLDFSEDGRLLASGGWEALARIRESGTGRVLGDLRAHGTAVYALAFEPGSWRLATGCVGSVRVWDVAALPGVLSGELPSGTDRSCVAISRDAGLLAWGGAPDGSIGVAPIAHPRAAEARSWKAHAAPVRALAFEGRGAWLASADRDGELILWDVAGGGPIRRWRAGSTEVRALAAAPDGSRIATAGSDGSIGIWRLPDGSLERSWKAHSGLILALAWSGDGKRIASGGVDWRVRLWEPGRTDPLNTWDHREWATSLAFSPDGRRLASGSADLRIFIGPPEGRPQVVNREAHAHWINAVAFLDRGGVVVSGGNDEALRFWNAGTGEELSTLSSRQGPIDALAVTADERMVLVGARRAVWLIDLGAAADRMDAGRWPARR